MEELTLKNKMKPKKWFQELIAYIIIFTIISQLMFDETVYRSLLGGVIFSLFMVFIMNPFIDKYNNWLDNKLKSRKKSK